jgi:hypothetical protein
MQPPFAPRPALSPYLDLVRGGNPAINYYLGTLPEQDRRAFQANPPTLTIPPEMFGPQAPTNFSDILPTLPQTGHATGFLMHGNFYNFPTQQRSFLPYNPPARR